MQYIKGLESYQNTRQTAITLGKFDGLHLGHEMLIERIIEHQKREDVDSVVFAFDMMPLYKKLNRENAGLVTNRERAVLLKDRVDYLIECPFTESISSMEAEAFIQQILVEQFHVKYVVVGHDFRFGYQKKGDYHMLESFSKIYGYKVEVIQKRCYKKREISSTYIKEELKKGNMQLVNKLLGYPYQIAGEVIHGKKLGRTIGFPTMNICPEEGKLLPPNGVYASRIFLDGKYYQGICNIGMKPTVSDERVVLLESYVFDYADDAYGKEIRIQLCDYVRTEQRFASVEKLKEAIKKDIEHVKKYFDSADNI